MGEKQIIGGIAPKSVPAEADTRIEETVIRTMQKDIDSLRDRASAESPQNLPIAEKGAKEEEERKRKEKEKIAKEQKKAEKRRKAEEQRIAEDREEEEERKKEKEEKIAAKQKKAEERGKKEQRKKEEQAKKKAVREQKKRLRALKIIAFKARLKANSPDLIRVSIISAAAILILGGAGGFLYWWNYLRVVVPPIAVTHYQCQDFQCVSVKGEGVDQCQTKQDCQPAEPEIPQSLIPVSGTEIIEVEEKHKELFINELELILAKDGEENILNNILVKTSSSTEKIYISLGDFNFISGINLPENIIQSAAVDEVGGANYTFFLYNQAEGKRLGFVLKIAEGVDLGWELKEWEANALEDINALFVNLDAQAPLATVEEFQDNIYNGIAIRYLNFPNPDLSVDYAVVGDKLIVATSRESMYAVIDVLLPRSPAE